MRALRSICLQTNPYTVGCAYPLALGAKLAAPERVVVAICGDGGFLYNLQEMATAVQHGVHAIALVPPPPICFHFIYYWSYSDELLLQSSYGFSHVRFADYCLTARFDCSFIDLHFHTQVVR